MLWVYDCDVCLVYLWVCRLMGNIAKFGFGTFVSDDNAPLWRYITKIKIKSNGSGGKHEF